jgi:hypothetical protein
MGKKAALVQLEIENRSGDEKKINLRFGFAGSVTKAVRTWNDAFLQWKKIIKLRSILIDKH